MFFPTARNQAASATASTPHRSFLNRNSACTLFKFPMPSLQEHLAKQQPATSGIHEAMALHTEDVFDEFAGIMPLFLGKRKLGSFVSLALPTEVTGSRDLLNSCLADLISAYDFRVVSFVSAIRAHSDTDQEPRLGAILITADNAKNLYQLPWILEFDSQANLTSHSRSEATGEIIPSEVWLSYFQQSREADEKQSAYNRLLEVFGDTSLLPEFSP